MLHTLNKSSFESKLFEQCRRLLTPEDVLLLIEDGVIGATRAYQHKELEPWVRKGRVYALKNDVEARGLTTFLNPLIKLVDYNGFVELVTSEDKMIAWF